MMINEMDIEEELNKENVAARRLTVFQQFKNACIEIFTNRTSLYTLIAGSLRFVGGYSLAYFKPTYFQSVYPEFDV
jgi:hypothetical protein